MLIKVAVLVEYSMLHVLFSLIVSFIIHHTVSITKVVSASFCTFKKKCHVSSLFILIIRVHICTQENKKKAYHFLFIGKNKKIVLNN